MKKVIFMAAATLFALAGCNQPTTTAKFDGSKGEVKLLTLDPGHFHAALVQMYMSDQVDPVVNVYAPAGDDAKMHLDRIAIYNNREQNPTTWQEQLYEGDDFLEKMLSERKRNVVVLAGNTG